MMMNAHENQEFRIFRKGSIVVDFLYDFSEVIWAFKKGQRELGP